MKLITYILATCYLLLTTCSSNAQELYYQNTFKGGASFDGVTYVGLDWEQADTIRFQNKVPVGCVLKKAYLISFKQNCGNAVHDTPLTLSYNNKAIQFDTADNATPVFYSQIASPYDADFMCIKDVTGLTQNSSNVLIIPSQNYISVCEYYDYDGFYLLLLYENNSFSMVNIALYLNDITNTNIMNYTLNNLNPINTANDVGLSIESLATDITPYLQYELSSATNTVTLGTLRDVSLNNAVDYKTGLGSFFYQNGTLTGLVDDINSPFIDSTDALCNIKTYLPNNSSSFSIISTTSNSLTKNYTTAFILAYSTPCPSVTAGADSIKTYKLCLGQSAQLNASAGYANYTWFPAAGLSNSAIAAPIAQPTGTSNYICYVKDAAGCMHTEYAKVIVHAPPAPQNIATTTAVCGNTLGVLTITPNYHHYGYAYAINNGVAQTDTVFSNLNAGQYTLTVTDSLNCTDKDTFSIIEVNRARSLFTIMPDSGCAPLSIYGNNVSNNTGNVTNAYVWYVNGDSATTQNLNYTFMDTGKYTITLLAYETLRRCSATTTQTVIVKDCPPDSIHVIVPNIFTPNSDGVNDTWTLNIYNRGYTISSYQCNIYDRWGINMFSSTNLNEAWPGKTTSGESASAGSYFYIIKLTATNSKGKSEDKEFKGYLELIR